MERVILVDEDDHEIGTEENQNLGAFEITDTVAAKRLLDLGAID